MTEFAKKYIAENFLDLVSEILDWQNTGLLHGGEGGKLRELARGIQNAHGMEFGVALKIAESEVTKTSLCESVQIKPLFIGCEGTIMNIQTTSAGIGKAIEFCMQHDGDLESRLALAYKMGHRDARHVAAEIVTKGFTK